ncbi:MAG: LPS assembly protein LptD [Candidatus Zhuqueibacterota bacterium]
MNIRFPLSIFCLSIISLTMPGRACSVEIIQDSTRQQQEQLQQKLSAVSLPDSAAVVDSLSGQIDSVKTPPQSSVGLDTILKYNAQSIDVSVKENKIYLVGKADVLYKAMHLTAEKITVDWTKNTLTAEGVPDTVWTKSENRSDSVMTVRWRGLPVLADAGDVMNGFRMTYNFDTEKGIVEKGRTEFEGGYYSGQSIKKVGRDVINFSNGYFTSCDKDEDPHYHFRSRRIKVLIGDKVIAKPVILYFGHMPVAALPFAVFPNKKGRHSGVIVPTYGESSYEGRFIRGLGYYWAPNDYFDTSMKVDYFDRSGWILRGDLNYALRYVLNGRVSGSFTRKDFISGQKQRRWDVVVSHQHTIDPTMRFTVSGSFVSDDKFYKDFSSNINTRLNRNIRSDATFSKNWTEQRLSLSANVSQERDIETGKIYQVLPQVRLSMSQRALFKKTDKRANSMALSSSKKSDEKNPWYESIYFSYSTNIYNSVTRGGGDPERSTRYLNHSASLSMNSPQKFFGWLTMGQSFSYQDRWYDRYRKNRFDAATNSVVSDTLQGFASKRTFSYNVNATTNIYGMFAPRIGRVQAIRHVITPNVSFQYQPNFSDTQWGYVDVFTDTSGNVVKASRFLDSVPGSTQKSMSFSIRNLFQMKMMDGEKEKKFDLFTLNFSSGYDFEEDSLRFSDVSSSFRSTIARKLNIDLSANHSFYKYDTTLNRTVDQYVIQDWKRGKFLRLNNLRLSASIQFQGSRKTDPNKKKEAGEEQVFIDEASGQVVSEQEYYDRMYEPGGNRFEVNEGFSGLDIPWRMSLAFSYSLSKYNPESPTKNYYLDITGMEAQLTKNWKISYTAHYDLQTKQVVNHAFTIYRDLHCWEARLTWRPSGIGGNSYYLRINVKAPQLRDLKYEQRGGRSSVLRY